MTKHAATYLKLFTCLSALLTMGFAAGEPVAPGQLDSRASSAPIASAPASPASVVQASTPMPVSQQTPTPTWLFKIGNTYILGTNHYVPYEKLSGFLKEFLNQEFKALLLESDNFTVLKAVHDEMIDRNEIISSSAQPHSSDEAAFSSLSQTQQDQLTNTINRLIQGMVEARLLTEAQTLNYSTMSALRLHTLYTSGKQYDNIDNTVSRMKHGQKQVELDELPWAVDIINREMNLSNPEIRAMVAKMRQQENSQDTLAVLKREIDQDLVSARDDTLFPEQQEYMNGNPPRLPLKFLSSPMIEKRNTAWLGTVLERTVWDDLEDGRSTLVVVGIAHLVGEYGILEQLDWTLKSSIRRVAYDFRKHCRETGTTRTLRYYSDGTAIPCTDLEQLYTLVSDDHYQEASEEKRSSR